MLDSHKAMRTLTMTLGGMLASRAESTPDRHAFTYSGDDVADALNVTYAELHRRAQAVAGLLLDTVAPGSHVLLLFEPGLEFIATIFGCFQAGIVGVSAMPPNPKRLHRIMPRLRAVIEDAQVRAVLSTAAIRDAARPLLAEGQALTGTPWIAVEDKPGCADPGLATCDPSELAFIQYTSGSTVDPRGVMLTHANLLANAEVIASAMGLSSESRAFSWLPPSHDMGLIFGILQPVFGGYPCALMSPLTVIKRPVRWLEGVSNFRATVSGAPNFAYDLAVSRTTLEQREPLELSCWEIAFNGAEPVQARTLEAFADTFAPHGFRRSSLYPCYGLAESTLMVAGPAGRREPTLLEVDAQHLQEDGVARPPTGSSRTVTLVGCGEPGVGYELAVVEPEERRRLSPVEIGEIWVSGPSVARGYWRREEQTRDTFGLRIAGEEGSRGFLRTGDLGFMRDGELFIVGRAKDLIILSGRNHHPHDLEIVSETAHQRLRPHCSAAFALESSEGLASAAIVLEVNPAAPEELPGIVGAVRRRVVHDLDLQLERIALVPPGAVPKTTSGKIQRRLCRQLLLEDKLELLLDWHLR